MYVPPHFAVEDREVLDRVIRENSFGILVSQTGDGPFASHLPLLLRDGVLLGHIAKANPHWKLLEDALSLAIFSGPHAYVSPRLYVTSPNVPTWNYVTVHVYGQPVVVANARAKDILKLSLDEYDPELPRTEDLDAYIDRQLSGIVAFEMPIQRMEGKFKLSQNKQPADRDSVIDAFGSSGHPQEQAVAKAMLSM